MSADANVWDRIADGNLGVSAGERFVVLRDEGIDVQFCAAANRRRAELVTAPSTGGHGREPHTEVWRGVFGSAAVARLEMAGVLDRLLAKTLDSDDKSMLDEWALQVAPLAPKAVLAVTHFSTSHTAFRRLLNAAGARYASMPLFQPFLLRKDGPLDLDPALLAERTQRLARRVEGAKRIRITTPRGTDLLLFVEGRRFLPDDGVLTAPGSFGNLPAGEVYVAPLEDTAEGTMVLESESPGGDTRLTIREGRIVEITQGTELIDLFREHPEYFRVAELGIGTNDKASRADNVLEAEKILGTVHVAFGDNSSFGGKQQIPYHVDHVLYQPTLDVDGQIIDLNAL
ncbi:MAG: aminopeptidase [Candidatus Hydrogenedentota bacterium]